MSVSDAVQAAGTGLAAGWAWAMEHKLISGAAVLFVLGIVVGKFWL